MQMQCRLKMCLSECNRIHSGEGQKLNTQWGGDVGDIGLEETCSLVTAEPNGCDSSLSLSANSLNYIKASIAGTVDYKRQNKHGLTESPFSSTHLHYLLTQSSPVPQARLHSRKPYDYLPLQAIFQQTVTVPLRL